MRKICTHKAIRVWLRQGMAGVLALVLMLGLLPAGTFQAQAASTEQSWAMPYMEQLVDWGVMRGDIDGNLYPNRNITRAEFVTMINRAYGYTDVGSIPFADVTGKEWYADDIAIAYKVGYFQGVAGNLAAPKNPLVREQAAMLLARNMMLQENPGEVLDFTDGRAFSQWSRGMVQAITALGVITGYPDGTFRPQNNITRGEASAMLVRAVGELVNTPGEHSLGSVYGNVTVNTSGVTLKNTVIVGNLYLTGGIGLGDVLLENVTVLGQIVVSGAGESNSAQSSVVMRNVEATEMIVDSINNQFVTVRAEGNTRIANTSVRTNGYVEDVSTPGFGLTFIELNGEAGTKLQLAGNIKEAVNRTPNSTLEMAQGAADKITIDEHATGSAVTIDRGARITDLNLDVACGVSGDGDIESLNVGAAGCTVTMLPDDISVRPGLTATIGGVSMDSATASEWSSEPRLLAGYPKAQNVSVSSATLLFSTNKAGTVYWAVTALADGSLDAETVISPPKNAAKIVASGSLSAAASQKEYTAEIKKLTSDGSYYISAVMVDARGNRSPLKVAAFGVPDETTPAFAKGYPRMSRVGTDVAQVTVMPNKSCQLYYALLPTGSTAPTGNEFKANAISGNLGYGSVDVVKNVTLPINVNSVVLEEQTTYDLYLWLTDYDGAKSSKVVKVTFTTADETPPIVTEIMQTNAQAAAAEVTYALNEPGTLYWAIVAEGDESFMNYDLDSMEAKVKVESGVGALKRGASNASKADTDVRINITGLNTKNTGTTSYTVYYIAKDKQGNYGDQVRMLNVRTLDTTPPTVKQEFTSYNGDDKNAPMPDTDIRLVFDESVRGGPGTDKLFLNLYQAVQTATNQTDRDKAREALASALRAHITLWYVPTSGQPAPVAERTWTPGDSAYDDVPWVIDWRYATVAMESGGSMVITLPTTEDQAIDPSALNLASGATYYFHMEGIYDNALTPNAMTNGNLPQFRTVYAQISLSNNETTSITVGTTQVELDMCLNVEPISTRKVADTERWDMILWSDTSVSLQVYQRDRTANQPWAYLGEATITVADTAQGGYSGISLQGDVITVTGQTVFPPLNPEQAGGLEEDHVYEYGIHFTQVGDLSRDDYDSWSNLVTMRYAIIAGGASGLGTVAGNVNRNYDAMIRDGSVTSIGLAYSPSGLTDILTLRHQFTDRSVPKFLDDSPRFTAGSSTVHMELALDREGTIYYVVAPANSITTTVNQNGGTVTAANDGRQLPAGTGPSSGLTYVPTSGVDRQAFLDYIAFTSPDLKNPVGYNSPTYLNIVNPRYTSSDVKKGSVEFTGVIQPVDIDGLKPSTRDENDNLVESWYYVYFVIQGGGEVYSPVQCYRFKMGEVEVPHITMSSSGGTEVRMTPDGDADLSYVLVELNSLPSFIRTGTIGVTDPETNRNMTVLKALTTRYSTTTGGETYFDHYATDDQKQTLSQYIVTLGGEYGTENQPKDGKLHENVAQNTTKTWDVEKSMDTERSEYIVLATARHVYGGSKGVDYGFAAVRGLYKPDRVAPDYEGPALIEPRITKVTDSAGNEVAQPVWMQNPTAYYYTGTVTVRFSKEVYLLINNERYEVWATNAAPTGTGSENAVSAKLMLGGDADSFTFTGSNVGTKPTNTFTFTFTEIGHGTTISLFDGGDICNGSSWHTTQKLELRFDTTLKMNSYEGGLVDTSWPGFRATWR